MPSLNSRPRPDEGFSLDGYRSLLGDLLSRGYAPTSFDQVDPARAHLILRHDIDMSLDAAVSLAKVENQLGIAATYFVLLRTDLYNPLSGSGAAALEAIATLGHEIGLHFDAALYAGDEASLEVGAARECDALERMTGRPIRMISFHRPARRLLDRLLPLAGRPHAYQPRFFSEIGYCSDSRGGWHHGHPLAHEAVTAGTALQLLTHPIWWVGEGGPRDRLRAFLRAHTEQFDADLAAHCGIHEPVEQTDDG